MKNNALVESQVLNELEVAMMESFKHTMYMSVLDGILKSMCESNPEIENRLNEIFSKFTKCEDELGDILKDGEVRDEVQSELSTLAEGTDTPEESFGTIKSLIYSEIDRIIKSK